MTQQGDFLGMFGGYSFFFSLRWTVGNVGKVDMSEFSELY